MAIVEVDEEIKDKLRKRNSSPLFLDSFLNAKFLSIQEIESEIVGVAYVGGIMNVYGIEVNKNYHGRGLWRKLFREIKNECKKRNISFLTGAIKASNVVSLKIHTKIGFHPIYTFDYNPEEGKEIVIFLPLNKKGIYLMKILTIFDSKIGNVFFSIFLKLLRNFFANSLSFTNKTMPDVDFSHSIKNFEKVEVTLETIMSDK